MTPAERDSYIAAYLASVDAFEAACAAVPEEAWYFKPNETEWSVHENVVHCADVDQLAAVRLKMMATEPHLPVIGIEQDYWADNLGYNQIPAKLALATIRNLRELTTIQLRNLPEESWAYVITHNEFGPYTIDDWLTYFSEHLNLHIAQIEQTVQAYHSSIQ